VSSNGTETRISIPSAADQNGGRTSGATTATTATVTTSRRPCVRENAAVATSTRDTEKRRALAIATMRYTSNATAGLHPGAVSDAPRRLTTTVAAAA
jgi:hypothetical protein